MVIAFCAGLRAAAQETPAKPAPMKDSHVLILTSYGAERPGVEIVISGFLSALQRNGIGIEQVFTENLDLERADDAEFRESLAEMLRRKYAQRHLDAVYIIEQPALDFFVGHMKDIAPGAPVLVARANIPAHPESTNRHFVSQLLTYDVAGTMKLAMELFPRTKRFLLISGATDSDRAVAEQAHELSKKWNGTEFTDTSGLALEQIQAEIARPAKDAVALVLPFNRDAKGRTTVQMETAMLVARTAKIPVFTLWDNVVGRGAVGGSVTNFSEIGSQAGQYAIDLMSGQRTLTEPVTILPSPSTPKLDWAQIERWSADTRDLPSSSVFINRPPTLWMQYKRTVIVTIILLIAQSLLIAGLLFQRHQRKAAQRALEESQARFRVLVEQAPEAIVVFDMAEMKLIEANTNAERLFGCDRQTLRGRGILPYYCPSSLGGSPPLETFTANAQSALNGDEVMVETDICSADKRKRTCEVRMVRLPSFGRQIIRASFIDITERKNADMAIQESRARLDFALDIHRIGAWDLDLANHAIQRTLRYDRIFGYDTLQPAWTHEVFLEHVLPDERALIDQSFRESLASGSIWTFECRIRRADGEIRWIWARGALEQDPEGQPKRMTGFVQDITERKEAEEALRNSEAELRTLAESIPQIVWTTQNDGRTIYFNRQWTEYTGLSPDQSRGPGWNIPFHPEDRQRALDAWQNAVANHRSYSLECRLRRADGVYRWWLVRGVPLIGQDGEILKWFGTCTDIHDLKEAEEERKAMQAELQQAQKMESLGSLAGGVAHDMNNVLGAILGIATAEIAGQSPGSSAHKTLDTIIQAATRGGKMVKSLLSFARQSPGEERDIDVNELLREDARMLEHTALSKARLRMELAPGLRIIRGDSSVLTHAFMNLCVNAVDAMREDGVLTLRTRNADSEWIEVEVEDNGSGMEPEVLEKAMDPFFTTKEVGKGTGLGLSMVYRAVTNHHGTMDISSIPGQGTCVRMRFPATSKRAEPAAMVNGTTAVRQLPALSVLLVDDDELIQIATQSLLGIQGHQAITVSSGEEALAKIEAGFKPDVIILDMNMPGLGGAGTLPKIRTLDPKVPVLLATGRVDQAALNLAKTYPHVTLLNKPYSLDDLQKKLEPIVQS